MVDRETIIETGDDGSGPALGIILAVVIVLLLVGGGFLAFSHNGSSSSVTLNVPKVTVTTPQS